jgi:4-aminobutyrate aminotransferase-like enzyme
VAQVNTYGGHPAAAAVAVRNIEILQEEKLAERAAEMGKYLMDALKTLYSRKHVGDVRGKGLLIGVELVRDRESKEPVPSALIGGVVEFCRQQGVIVGRSGGGAMYSNTIAICPPLVITRAECDRLVEVVDKAMVWLEGKLAATV